MCQQPQTAYPWPKGPWSKDPKVLGANVAVNSSGTWIDHLPGLKTERSVTNLWCPNSALSLMETWKIGQKPTINKQTTRLVKSAESSVKQGVLSRERGLPATGIEPVTDGLENRCSIHWATRAPYFYFRAVGQKSKRSTRFSQGFRSSWHTWTNPKKTLVS